MEGRGGKVAKSVREALLLPEDMKHWAKWDNDSLLLTIKREAIMVTISSHSNYYFLHFSFFFFLFLQNHYLHYMIGVSMLRGDQGEV